MPSPGSPLRLRRLRGPSERILLLALDHGLPVGPIPGLEDPRPLVRVLLGSPVTAILANPGVLPHLASLGASLPPLVAHLSAGTVLGRRPTSKVLACSVERALALGADAVSVQVHFGDEAEDRMLRDAGSVIDRAGDYGLPVLVMAYPPGAVSGAADREATRHAARAAADLGADLVQIPHPGTTDAVRAVVRGCFVPLLVAGGPRAATPEAFLESVAAALAGGAAGVAVGRNLFQHPDPAGFARRIGEVLAAPVPAGILVKA